MRSNVEIRFGGKVSDAEAIFEVASSAAAEGTLDWFTCLSTDEFPDLLVRAAEEGTPIVLKQRDTYDFFEGLREACREAGLSYVVLYGSVKSQNYKDGFAWKPGMSDEQEFKVEGEDQAFTLNSVREAAQSGIDAIASLIGETERLLDVGKIEIEPGFFEAYEEYSGHRPSAPAPRR